MAFEFKFKEFSIFQSNHVFKISTDSLILGAISLKIASTNVLEVGCGTGVIMAMYLSKMSVEESHVVDINKDAIILCRENLKQFKQTVFFHHKKYQETHLDTKIDLIVSNPPYFSNSLKPIGKLDQESRHNNSLSAHDFWLKNNQICTENSTVLVILPSTEVKKFNSEANNFGFFINFQLDIIGKENGKIIRNVLLFKKSELSYKKELLVVRNQDNSYHESYRLLLKDFLVIF
jgi:tRNA1Val (adenine37-N6)-methyltransferase